jgi:P-type Cu2+ transporter
MTACDRILEPTARTQCVCAHCAQPVPPGLIDDSADLQFCCGGCRAAYETIHSCGLENYYRLRDAVGASGRSVEPVPTKYEVFDSTSFQALYVKPRAGGLLDTDLLLGGVTCAACVWLVEKLPRLLDGVIDARLSLRDGVVNVVWDPTRVPLSRIAQTLTRLGYEPHPARGIGKREMHRREERKRLIELAAAGAIAGNQMLLGFALYAGWFGHLESEYWQLFRWVSLLLGVISLAWPGATFFRGAWTAIRTRSANLDLPIVFALGAGGAAGLVNVILGRGEVYFDSLAALIFLLLVGRFLQFRQQRRADDAVELLFSMTPSTARRKTAAGVESVPIESLVAGDVVEIRSGDIVPADGVVEAGSSSIDQSLLSGESVPVTMGRGDPIAAGAKSLGGAIDLRVERVGSETRIGRLMKLVETGVREKPPIVAFTDRVAAYFVVIVIVAAAGVFGYWAPRDFSAALDHTVAFLIVTCPCVVGLITPLTMAMTIGRLARRNVLVKSGAALEKLARSGHMVLDKTGTITRGNPAVIDWIGDASVAPIVSAVERRSNHPIAKALVAHAPPAENVTITDLTESAGGISATVNGQRVWIGATRQTDVGAEDCTAVDVTVDGEHRATILLRDTVRADSASTIVRLRDRGWTIEMLSGDRAEVAQRVAGDVGISQVEAQATPERKLQRVRELRSDGRTLVMVGDGVNDAAALAAADVGIAVQGGAEASLAAADVYIATPGLAPVASVIDDSRRMMRLIRRNLVITVAYNVLAGSLAAAGLMHPMWAAIIMPASSATVLSLTMAAIMRSKP